jgi:hypothetical protein
LAWNKPLSDGGVNRIGPDRGLEAQSVTDAVESHGTEKLGEEHRCQMARHGAKAGYSLNSGFFGDPFDHSTRNEVEHLFENDNSSAK